MTEARWSATGDTFLVGFETGERFLLPVAALAHDAHDAAAFDRERAPYVEEGGFALLLPRTRGDEPLDVGWDTVRYHCDARYRAEADRRATENAAALGERVAEVRKRAGMTQEALAKRSGVSRVNIARIESGAVTPSFATLGKLAGALGIPLGALVGEKI